MKQTRADLQMQQAGKSCREGIHRVGETMMKQASQFGITEESHALAFVRMVENMSWENMAMEARMRSGTRADYAAGNDSTAGQEKMLRIARKFGVKDKKRAIALLNALGRLFWEKVAIKATYDAQIVSIRANLEFPGLQTDSSDDNSKDEQGISSDEEESELEDYMPSSLNKDRTTRKVPTKGVQQETGLGGESWSEGEQNQSEEEETVDPYQRQHKFKVGEQVYLNPKVGLGPVTPTGPGRVIEHTRDKEGNPTYTIGELLISFRQKQKNVEEKLLEHYSVNQERPKRQRPIYPNIDDM